ncbi:MAG: MBL fold metallo-hydrolase [Gammaproteobacteria bacterium]|nr:MBL fold metallo-hydrolase [Gammaproteobacteria bacterium]MBU1625611.1 MBL fold metallo-hydrolase [Gammaproteobacteria bacterium]MBU1980871.1 MBL fold metallo-hydrolase [Gammaproteobacteria bacterium]
MRFAFLGSGSEGNSLLVQAGSTTLMLDCGFSTNEAVSRLARLGMQAEQLNGILVTHEHSDHIGGVARLARKFKLPVWMTHGTLLTQRAAFADISVTELNPHHSITIGDIEVQPFLVPHDAREPVQYVFSDGQHRLGVLTDTGHITPHIEESLTGCHAMVLECNHDEEMLRTGRYPASLKQRVGGRLGHLSNRQAAGLLESLDTSCLKHIVAAHLSKQNNQPELAALALSTVLSCKEEEIVIASQSDGLQWVTIA